MFPTFSLLAAVATLLQGPPARAAASASRAVAAAPAAADLAFATLPRAAPEEPKAAGSSLRAVRNALGALLGVPAWAQQDPGDSLYRAGRQLLNRGRYPEAARAFNDLIKRYPRSSYTPDAHYWAAFALYRTGDQYNLLAAAGLLETQASRYPRAATRGDGDALLARVYGELARRHAAGVRPVGETGDPGAR